MLIWISEMTDPSVALEARLKTMAGEIGFADCRICRADEPWEAGERLEAFVAEGRHGGMEWMETTLERRRAPTAMWPEARSAVMLAIRVSALLLA